MAGNLLGYMMNFEEGTTDEGAGEDMTRREALEELSRLNLEMQSMEDYSERSDFAFEKYRKLLNQRKKLKKRYSI